MRRWLLVVLIWLGLLFSWAIAVSAQAQAVNQDPDVPLLKSTCQMWLTHMHVSGRTYQLTCSDSVPDSLMVYPARTR